MKINVTENKVSIKEEQILNENEYNIHKIQFDFSSEYTDDLVKVALFSIDNHTYKKIISNNECDIPPEVLTKRGYSILGVYAYKTEQDTLVLRYSPSPTRISVYDGSYKAEAENSEPITPSEIEQYQQILQNSLQQFQNQYNVLVEEAEGDIQAIENELQRKVDEGYFDGEDGYTPQKGIDYFTEQDIEEIENGVKNDLQETVLVNYSLIAETGSKIELSINTTNYKLTAILKDKNNATIYTSNEIDLPLETMVVSASYDNTTKEIILTLQNGNTVRFSVADLVSGLVSEAQLQTILANYYTQTEINNLLANKVDKVAGKGLSTNDFTDEYKEQVDTNTEDIEDIQEEQTEQNTEIGNLKVILSEKGTYSKPSTGIPKTDLSNAVQTSLNKADTALQSHQDISGKQDITDNTLTTINKTVPTAINEVNSIAKGANQALSYGNYQTMITAFNALANNVYNVGQNVMIVTLQVPDLWISGIESTSSAYTYTTDEAFTTALAINGYVQVGYYKLSALETQKVDLTNYVTNTDYVESGKAGIIRLSSGLGASNGYIYLTVYSYENYNNATNGLFIGKGTLENVITGKNLETGNNKVTTISSSSTNTEYPSAKAVYDYIQSLDGDEVSY